MSRYSHWLIGVPKGFVLNFFRFWELSSQNRNTLQKIQHKSFWNSFRPACYHISKQYTLYNILNNQSIIYIILYNIQYFICHILVQGVDWYFSLCKYFWYLILFQYPYLNKLLFNCQLLSFLHLFKNILINFHLVWSSFFTWKRKYN